MLRDFLKILLNQNGVSQKDIAEQIEVSENTVSRFFSNKSDMKCDQFIEMLKLADIDLQKIIMAKLAELSEEKPTLNVFEKLKLRQREKFVEWHSESTRGQ